MEGKGADGAPVAIAVGRRVVGSVVGWVVVEKAGAIVPYPAIP